MKLAQSRLTSRGQVSIPAEIRRRLGLVTGSILEWAAEGGRIVVRRGHRHSSVDIHRSLFPEGKPDPHNLDVLKAGIRRIVAKRPAHRGHQRP